MHAVSGKDLRITAEGDRLEIDHAQLSWENWLDVFRNLRPGAARTDVSILVPREAALKLGVVSASALVSGLHADTDLSTVSGDLATDALTGALHVNAVSGELTARNHAGRVTVHTVSGDVTVTGPATTFVCDGVSGDVFLDLADVPDAVKINTVSGDVAVRLGTDAATAYAINSVGGKLQLDDSSFRPRGRFTGKYRDLDGRWTDLRVNTVSGDITVLHVARADAETAAP